MLKILISCERKFQLPKRVNYQKNQPFAAGLFKGKCVKRAAKGFSLVELLMALLVASLLLAALAPVMTKKMHDIVDFGGDGGNSAKHRTVYLTEPGDGEWVLPDGIRTFDVTVVGGGGGGGAAGTYGCVVFTTESGAYLGKDADYCEIRRGNGDMSFTIPQGVDEIYVSMVSGAGGGAGGSAKWAQKQFDASENWAVPALLLGDRIGVAMSGAGGGGGGADQGGGGGGSAGAMNGGMYDIAQNKTSIRVDVGKGGKGGRYWNNIGKGGAGWKNGGDGVLGAGGGGGGSSAFDNGAISAYGGGGGAGQCVGSAGWANSGALGASGLWKTYFNTGGDGKNGGYCGSAEGYNGYGGLSGGAGGDGDIGDTSSSPRGRAGQDGTVGDDGAAKGSARGGAGGAGSNSYGAGKGGRGQDGYSGNTGGAGGGGGGGGWGSGSSAFTGCGAPSNYGSGRLEKAGVGAGGAGASCNWNEGGGDLGGEGGDGRGIVRYLSNLYGGTGGQAGKVVPRSRVALTTAMNAGKTLTITPGKGGTGGDRVILIDQGNPANANSPSNIRTINKAGVINTSDTTLSNANGKPGSPSTVKFNGTLIGTTWGGSCGGGYHNTSDYKLNCTGTGSCGTSTINGSCISMVGGWHGNQNYVCNWDTVPMGGNSEKGGASTVLAWDSADMCGVAGGIAGTGSSFSKRNGTDGTTGLGGSGAYYGGFGGKGGDGYIKIEWGIPRNIDKTAAARYSGGGGSAGETVVKRVTLPLVTNKVRYRIGDGGIGGRYGSATGANGANGEDTVFGAVGSGDGFDQIKAKGGRGGKGASVTSTYDANFIITSLVGNFGAGGTAQCYTASNCTDTMNGSAGADNAGGRGGSSTTGVGAAGGTGDNPAGSDGTVFNGYAGGGAGGGGGVSVYGASASAGGGKGGRGYIKIEYID